MIFISHAWVSGKPDERVLSFVNMLRENGYEAQCDVMITQAYTAIHFQEMMAKALKESDKTIVVLSKEYKTKADNFQGGVGEEFRYIIEDFKINPNKYILVSFEGRNGNIIPDFIKGRDIVDLSEDKKAEYRELFSKLASAPKYEFSPVATHKTVPVAQKISTENVIRQSSTSSRLGINLDSIKPVTDLDKKNFIKSSFHAIIELLKELTKEVSLVNSQLNFEVEKFDEYTYIFTTYTNGSQSNNVQIWLGNQFSGHIQNILIANSIFLRVGDKSSCNERIVCNEVGGVLLLELTMHGLHSKTKNDGSIESITKQIWEIFFQRSLK